MINIGIMSFAHMHADSYANCINACPDANLAGIADEDAARGKEKAKQYNTTYFDSFEKLLATDIDAVIVTSANADHRRMVELAASHKKHVLCEKPIATILEDAQAMIDTCKSNGVSLGIAYPCRYSIPVARAKEMLDTGQIGDILAVMATNHGSCPGGWFTDLKKSGGGAVMDHTVHIADLLRWFLDDEAVEVFAEVDNTMNGKDFDDCGCLSIKFADGAFATQDPSWSRQSAYPTWGDVTMKIIGTKSVVTIDAFDQNANMYCQQDGKHVYVNYGDNMDMEMICDFVRCLQEGRPFPITGYDGYKTLEITLAAYESAKTHKSVAIA